METQVSFLRDVARGVVVALIVLAIVEGSKAGAKALIAARVRQLQG